MNENAIHQPTMTVDRDGTKWWELNGKRHREDGPAIECVDGYKSWWLHDVRHREDGPAVEHANGDKSWWLHDVRHREDGPAIENANGHKGWYLNGSRYEDIFEWARALLTSKGINDPSEDEIIDRVQQVTSASILD